MNAAETIFCGIGIVTVIACADRFVRYLRDWYEDAHCWTFEPELDAEGVLDAEYASKYELVRTTHPAVAALFARIIPDPEALARDPLVAYPYIVFNRHGALIELSWCNVVATIRAGEIADLDYEWDAATLMVTS